MKNKLVGVDNLLNYICTKIGIQTVNMMPSEYITSNIFETSGQNQCRHVYASEK